MSETYTASLLLLHMFVPIASGKPVAIGRVSHKYVSSDASRLSVIDSQHTPAVPSWPHALAEASGLSCIGLDTRRPYAVCRLQTLVNYALKAERELWGLLDGPWDGPSYADHRRTWSSQVGPCCDGLRSQRQCRQLLSQRAQDGWSTCMELGGWQHRSEAASSIQAPSGACALKCRQKTPL